MLIRFAALVYIPKALKSFMFHSKIVEMVVPENSDDSIPPAQISLQPALKIQNFNIASQTCADGVS